LCGCCRRPRKKIKNQKEKIKNTNQKSKINSAAVARLVRHTEWRVKVGRFWGQKKIKNQNAKIKIEERWRGRECIGGIK